MDVEKLVEDGARAIALSIVSIPGELPTPEQTAFAEDNWRLYAPAARAVIRLTLEAAAGDMKEIAGEYPKSGDKFDKGAFAARMESADHFRTLAASIGGNND